MHLDAVMLPGLRAKMPGNYVGQEIKAMQSLLIDLVKIEI